MAGKGKQNKLNIKVIIYTSLVVLFGAAFIVCAGKMIHDYKIQKEAERQFAEMSPEVLVTETQIQTETETETEEPSIIEQMGITIPQLALDWENLETQNADIYSWIYIPNTKVNYPVLQHPTEDDYYLDHNLDGTQGLPGCIYTQGYNTKTYRDGNTILYGHNMKNGSMFKTLHSFEKEEFFQENRYIYIYTPESVLVYEIFAATEYTNEHILYKYNFSEEGAVSTFAEDILQMKGNSSNNHYLEDAVITDEDKLVTLSTCIGGRATSRWIVIGRLLGEEPMDYAALSEAETEIE